MREVIYQGMGLGIHSQLTADLIPRTAAQSALGWASSDGIIELCRGKQRFGADETGSSYTKGLHVGYKTDGTAVFFRKINTVVQYATTPLGTWTDVITGLTTTAEYTFSNYTSLAGSFVYITGADGIYKIVTANPGQFATLYDSTKNYKGKSIIDKGRMFMWDLPNDKTGLYGSYIDVQDSTVYTTVSAEVVADTASGTLGFKAGDAKRTCFGVVITDTSSGEVFRDNYLGVLTGSLGGTGTINYMTGAFTTSQSGAGTADYQWEMTNNHGVTDFSKSAPRTAGQGFVFRQDEGGDAIQNVLLQDGNYYSIKSRSVYELNLTNTDTNATNTVFRRDIGLPYWRTCVATSKGMVLMDTSNPSKPMLTIIQKNITGDSLEAVRLATHFDFAPYLFDRAPMGTHGEVIVFGGRTPDNATNNRMFLYNPRLNSVDVLPYTPRVFTHDAGLLYFGDDLSENTWQVLSGFDDDNYIIENEWIGKNDNLDTEQLKRFKWLPIRGLIVPGQSFAVYVQYDNSGFSKVGTILGDGAYVDTSNPITIGAAGIGINEIGGGSGTVTGYKYYTALKLSPPKFGVMTIKLVALGIGYVSVEMMKMNNIMLFANKLPSKYLQKQHVSLDGLTDDLQDFQG